MSRCQRVLNGRADNDSKQRVVDILRWQYQQMSIAQSTLVHSAENCHTVGFHDPGSPSSLSRSWTRLRGQLRIKPTRDFGRLRRFEILFNPGKTPTNWLVDNISWNILHHPESVDLEGIVRAAEGSLKVEGVFSI